MNLVTTIWAIIVSACLTLALVHLLVWLRRREALVNLLFSLWVALPSVNAVVSLSP